MSKAKYMVGQKNEVKKGLFGFGKKNDDDDFLIDSDDDGDDDDDLFE